MSDDQQLSNNNNDIDNALSQKKSVRDFLSDNLPWVALVGLIIAVVIFSL